MNLEDDATTRANALSPFEGTADVVSSRLNGRENSLAPQARLCKSQKTSERSYDQCLRCGKSLRTRTRMFYYLTLGETVGCNMKTFKKQIGQIGQEHGQLEAVFLHIP